MEINLIDDLYLRSDPRCLILAKRVMAKDDLGELVPTFNNLKYYHSIAEVIKGTVDLKINLSDATTFEQLVDDYNRDIAAIKMAVAGLELLL